MAIICKIFQEKADYKPSLSRISAICYSGIWIPVQFTLKIKIYKKETDDLTKSH